MESEHREHDPSLAETEVDRALTFSGLDRSEDSYVHAVAALRAHPGGAPRGHSAILTPTASGSQVSRTRLGGVSERVPLAPEEPDTEPTALELLFEGPADPLAALPPPDAKAPSPSEDPDA